MAVPLDAPAVQLPHALHAQDAVAAHTAVQAGAALALTATTSLNEHETCTSIKSSENSFPRASINLNTISDLPYKQYEIHYVLENKIQIDPPGKQRALVALTLMHYDQRWHGLVQDGSRTFWKFDPWSHGKWSKF